MDIASLATMPPADKAITDVMELGLERHMIEMHAYGFTVIPPETTGVSEDFVVRLRDALLRIYGERHGVAMGDHETGTLPVAGRNIWWLLEEDDVIVESVLHPVVLAVARWMCGQSAILSGVADLLKGAETAGKTNDTYLPLHSDAIGVPHPFPQMVASVNISWVTTEYLSYEDGPTVLVPGSHHFGRKPRPRESSFWENDAPYKPIPLIAKPGSLAVWQGYTWHGSTPRRKPGLRVTLITNWIRSYIRPIHLWRDGTSPDLIERFPELEKILGMKHIYPYREYQEFPESIPEFSAAGEDRFA